MKFFISFSITLLAIFKHTNCAFIESKKLPSNSFGPLKSLSLPSDSLPGNLGWSSSVEQLVNTVGGNVASPVVKQVIAAGKNATKLDKEAAHVVVHTLIKHLASHKNETISKNGTKIEAGNTVGKNATIINGKIENKNVTGNGTKIENKSGQNATVTNGKSTASKNATVTNEKPTSKNATAAENGKNSTNTHETIANKNATSAAKNGTAKGVDNSAKNGTVVDHPNLKNQTSENGKNSTTKADSPAAGGDKPKPTGATTADKTKPGDAKNKPVAGADKKSASKKTNNGNKANAPGQQKKAGAAKK